MKYMLLIYTDEKAWTEAEREQCLAESTALTHKLHQQGKYLVLLHCTQLRLRPAFASEKEVPGNGRPFRRDPRTTRRLLPDRRGEPRRRDRNRRTHSWCQRGLWRFDSSRSLDGLPSVG